MVRGSGHGAPLLEYILFNSMLLPISYISSVPAFPSHESATILTLHFPPFGGGGGVPGGDLPGVLLFLQVPWGPACLLP